MLLNMIDLLVIIKGNDLKLPYTKYETKDFINECSNQKKYVRKIYLT